MSSQSKSGAGVVVKFNYWVDKKLSA